MTVRDHSTFRDRSAPGRSRGSDEATFETFYQDQYRSVVGLGYVLSGDRCLAEDLAQEAFAAAHHRWATISRYDKPEAWLRRVLINRWRSRGRRMAVETRVMTHLGGQLPEVSTPSERSEEIWAAVRALPERQAQAIALRYWDGLSISEIADVLVCGSETVKTHLQRAKAALSSELQTEHQPLAA